MLSTLARCASRVGARTTTPALAARQLQSAADAAADVSYARGLFFGVNNDRAFPYPQTLDEDARETLGMLCDPIAKFYESEVDSPAMDKTKVIPAETLDGLREMGLFGLQIPEEHGGLGLNNTAYGRVVEEIVRDASLAVTLMAHQSIGLKGILLAGNAAQKAQHLPALASGEHMAAFVLTEPGTGSDAAGVVTRATRTEGGWLINGTKCYISNGAWSDVMTVFAQTEVDGEDKMTAFIVDKASAGDSWPSFSEPEDKLGIRASGTYTTYFEDTFVPMENVLGGGADGCEGGEAGVGKGFKVAMQILNNGRFGLGIGCGAMLRRVLAAATDHATSRVQFGSPLSDFGLIQKKLAKIASDAYVAESMGYLTTQAIDRGENAEIEAAICKVFGSEVAFDGVNETIQVLGGSGFICGTGVEQIMRDSRILSIFEGTNEILRLLIALQPLRAVGARLSEVGAALKNPLSNPGSLVGELSRRLSSSAPAVPAHPSLAGVAAALAEHTAAFGKAVEAMLRTHKKEVIHQQLDLERVANIAIDLYGITAALSRATMSLEQGVPHADHERLLVEHFAHAASQRVQTNLAALASDEETEADRRMAEISAQVCDAGGYLPVHPLRC